MMNVVKSCQFSRLTCASWFEGWLESRPLQPRIRQCRLHPPKQLPCYGECGVQPVAAPLRSLGLAPAPDVLRANRVVLAHEVVGVTLEAQDLAELFPKPGHVTPPRFFGEQAPQFSFTLRNIIICHDSPPTCF